MFLLVEARQEASVILKAGSSRARVPSPLHSFRLLSPGRPAKASSGRALSVEDVSAPSQVRTVGRVVEVFPDGTTQLQLQRSPEGTFGFCVASGNGRRDSGMPPPLSGLHIPGTLANRFWLWSFPVCG